jgi:O-acetyl-ADP-ribose deacetylase (regulator of RNase III)
MVISTAVLDAHRIWVQRGRAGEGRLVLEDQEAAGQVLTGHTLAGASIERCRLDGAQLDGTTWQEATIRGSSFLDAVFGDAVLDDAVFTDCDLRGADFSVIPEGPRGTTARTRFERCDLRGTVWIDRSLAGAVFIDCRFESAAGTPRDFEPLEIIRPDLSVAGDGSLIGSASDVLTSRWQVYGKKPHLDAEDKAFIRRSLLAGWKRRQRPAPAVTETQHCPLCERAVRRIERYPRYICNDCLDLVTDRQGRRVDFANESFSGGFVGFYAGSKEPYSGHECFVRGVRCDADEARFGGIVHELAVGGNPRIQVVEADITTLAVDAIVNPAHSSLLGGGGVDGAIHRVAGPELLDECRTLGGCDVGDAKITRGYRLPAPWVIHTVGPVWKDGRSGERSLLALCYSRPLEIASERGLRSVAFPLIGTGAHRYPLDQAVKVAVMTVEAFLAANPMPRRVLFCTFGDEATRAVVARLAELQPAPATR